MDRAAVDRKFTGKENKNYIKTEHHIKNKMKDHRDPHDTVSYFQGQRKKMAARIARVKKSWKLPTLLFLLLVFLGSCAVVFKQLESDHDRELYEEHKKNKLALMQRYNMTENEFTAFMVEATLINKKGYSGEYKNYWGFYHSFWFTITVITTMGFGQVVPVTFWGRFFCIICALLGIPLNALVLKQVGENISKLISDVIRKVEKRVMRRATPQRIGAKCAVISFTLMIIVICIGGALDTIFDGWTFFDGVYFNFIALSTIGFGDLFPRTDQAAKLDRLGLGDDGKRIFASSVMLIYMIIGLSITSTVIYSIIKAIEEASQIQVQWSRRVRLVDVLSLRKLSRKHKSRDSVNNNNPHIVISPASDDNGDISDTAGSDIEGTILTVTSYDNEGLEEGPSATDVGHEELRMRPVATADGYAGSNKRSVRNSLINSRTGDSLIYNTKL